MELLLGLLLPPLAEHVFPLLPAVESHPNILQAHDDWLHATSPENLVVSRPNLKVEVFDGLVDGVEDVVVRPPCLVLVSRETVELGRTQQSCYGEPVWSLQLVSDGVVDSHLVPVPDSLHEHPGLHLHLVLARQPRVAGSTNDLQDIVQAGYNVGVDWPRDLAVDS